MNRPIIQEIKEVSSKTLEVEMRKSLPPVLYKYRSWESDNHKKALLNSEIWFSNPKELNDLYDIRLAYTFDPTEIDKPEFFEELRKQFVNMTRLTPGTRDFEVALQNHFDYLIKPDPQKWFLENQISARESIVWEQIGLFSATTDPLNKLMWAHYGNSHKGYCIGYDPFLIFKTQRSFCGTAHYIDEPIQFSFIRKEYFDGFTDLFIKESIWKYEKEYRFLTFVENNNERLVTLPKSAIKEVILGKNISLNAETEVIKCLRGKYDSKVNLFKVEDIPPTGLSKNEIRY